MRNNFDSIKNELTSFINKFKVLSIRQRQALFLQCIMSFDKTFFDYLMNSNEDAHIYYSESGEAVRRGSPEDSPVNEGSKAMVMNPRSAMVCA